MLGLWKAKTEVVGIPTNPAPKQATLYILEFIFILKEKKDYADK